MIAARHGAGNCARCVTAESIRYNPLAIEQNFARSLPRIPRHPAYDTRVIQHLCRPNLESKGGVLVCDGEPFQESNATPLPLQRATAIVPVLQAGRRLAHRTVETRSSTASPIRNRAVAPAEAQARA